MSIYLEKHGKGYPLVFFHGWGFNQTIWHGLIPELSEHFCLYLLDLPGFGETCIMEWEEYLNQVALLLPAQFSVIGWSLGGLYATELALRYPGRIQSLINISSSPCFIKKESWPGIEGTVFQQFNEKLRADNQGTLEEFMRLQSRGVKAQYFRHKPLSISGLDQGLKMIETLDLREKIKALTCPIHYIQGRLDAIIPATLSETMKRTHPQFEYSLIKKAAHMPFVSHPEDTLSIIDNLVMQVAW